MARRQLLTVATIGLTGVLVTIALGFDHWGPWGQLLATLVVMVLASFGAPDWFGWREPRPRRSDGAPRRRR